MRTPRRRHKRGYDASRRRRLPIWTEFPPEKNHRVRRWHLRRHFQQRLRHPRVTLSSTPTDVGRGFCPVLPYSPLHITPKQQPALRTPRSTNRQLQCRGGRRPASAQRAQDRRICCSSASAGTATISRLRRWAWIQSGHRIRPCRPPPTQAKPS